MPADIDEQYSKIYRYCYYRTKDANLAEDLTQETFLKFFSQSSYINRGKDLAYLYTIARNLCIDNYKTEHTLTLSDVDTEEESLAAIDIGYQELESALTVKKAVEALPKDMIELILLRIINELSMNEISLITGLSRFSIRRKLNVAIKQLKNTIRREDFYE